MRLNRRFLLGIVVLAVALTLLWAARAPLLRAMMTWLDVGQRPRYARYVMVLTGDERSRPLLAAALLKAKLAQHALITEVAMTPYETVPAGLPYHEVNCRVLQKRGIARSDITMLLPPARTTYDEARALAAFLRNRPDARVLVVTNDYHTRRSRWVFDRVLGQQAAQISFVSAPTDDVRRDCWWQDEIGFVRVVAEYFKLAFYVVCYGYVGHWLAACAGLALVIAWAHSHARYVPQPDGL